MKKVTKIFDLIHPREEKKMRFTHFLTAFNEWKTNEVGPNNYDTIVHLGLGHGGYDYFAAYNNQEPNNVSVYRGELNSGTY